MNQGCNPFGVGACRAGIDIATLTLDHCVVGTKSDIVCRR